VGRWSLPRARAEEALGRIKDTVRKWLQENRSGGSRDGRTGAPSSEDLAVVLGSVIAAIGEAPIPTQLRIDDKHVRIVGIGITPDVLSLRIEPVGRKALPGG